MVATLLQIEAHVELAFAQCVHPCIAFGQPTVDCKRRLPHSFEGDRVVHWIHARFVDLPGFVLKLESGTNDHLRLASRNTRDLDIEIHPFSERLAGISIVHVGFFPVRRPASLGLPVAVDDTRTLPLAVYAVRLRAPVFFESARSGLGNTNDCHQMDKSSCSTLLIWFACLI
jgi:hypothetical protein